MSSSTSHDVKPKIDPSQIPKHVAIIMDGNGRWAKKRLMNRVKGHEKGSEVVRNISRSARKIGIQFLTLYAFSTENWQRPKEEVDKLMKLLKKFLIQERDELSQNNIQLNAIGELEKLPQFVRDELEKTIALTRTNSKMTLNLALSYGGRTELVHSFQKIAELVQKGMVQPNEINDEVVTHHLYTRDMPDPDLLIRTSGEMRISNFLLWQIAYAEIFITKTLWPDFAEEEFLSIIAAYQQRDRRYGKVIT